MQDPEFTTAERDARRRRLRIVSLLAAALIVVAGVLVVMNLSASKADGASSQEKNADSAAPGDGAQTGAQDADKGEGEGEEAESEADDDKAPVPVEIARVETGTVSAYISSTANLVAEFEVKVLAEVEGRLLTLGVDEGDFVRKGEVLATLVRDDQQIRVRKAQLKGSNARMAFERARDLIDKELISREEYDKLEIDYGIAQQELAEAEWTLSKTMIRAPFSGRVTQRTTQVGQHVRIGDELFQITDFDPLIARIYLPERDVLGLSEGRDVRLRLNAAADVEFPGKIRQISPVVDTATGTVKITVETNEPPVGVRPGSFVTVDITRETRNDALLLPREAVLRELQKAHVFVAGAEVAEKRVVQLGLEEGEYVEALSGVGAGESVIVAGQGGLKDGSPIKILDAAESTG